MMRLMYASTAGIRKRKVSAPHRCQTRRSPQRLDSFHSGNHSTKGLACRAALTKSRTNTKAAMQGSVSCSA
ncbi:hypothetical protein BKA80DRAFT_284598 [Phyllosticta citrichinensis]